MQTFDKIRRKKNLTKSGFLNIKVTLCDLHSPLKVILYKIKNLCIHNVSIHMIFYFIK